MHRSTSGKLRTLFLSAATLALTAVTAHAAPITAGNLVLTRAGDGAAPLAGGGVAASVILDEYTPAGLFVQSIAVNNTLNATIGSQRALTFSGTANTEGAITLSQNGQYMAFGGYNQTAGVAGTNGSAATTVERVVGVLNLSTGGVDTSTALVDAMSSQNIRSAYTTNGTNVWVTGNGGNNVTVNAVPNITTSGVHFAQVGVNTGGNTLSTQLNTTGVTTNNRVLNVFGFTPRLYVSSAAQSAGTAAPARGPDTFAAGGIPMSGGNVLNSLPGFPTGNIGTPASAPAPDDYWFMDDSTVYVADARVDGNGGIQKWTFDGANWVLQYTLGGLTTVGGGSAGAHGLTGQIVAGQAVLFAVTLDGAGANQNKLVTVTDIGPGSLYATLLTSPTNTAFRGVEINLLPPVPEPGSLALLALAGVGLLRRSRNRG